MNFGKLIEGTPKSVICYEEGETGEGSRGQKPVLYYIIGVGMLNDTISVLS